MANKGPSSSLAPSEAYLIEHSAHNREYLLEKKKELTAQLLATKLKMKDIDKLVAKKKKGPKQVTAGAISTKPPERMISVGGLTLDKFMRKQHGIQVETTKILNDKFVQNEAIPKVFNPGTLVERVRHEQIVRNHNKKRAKDSERAIKEREEKAFYKEYHRKRTLEDIQAKAGKPVYVSMFPNRYKRAELPCTIEHGIKGHYLSWACPLENLDYSYYLPVFFDGLQTDESPSDFLSRQGVEDLLLGARGHPERVIPSLKPCARYLRNALSTFKPAVVLAAFKAIQQLLKVGPSVGEALMPYGKLFLGPIAAFLEMTRNIGDQIDYGQRRCDDIGEEARKTLEMLEENGGPRAFHSIKTSIPTYKSCVYLHK